MLILRKGCQVPFPEMLVEGCEYNTPCFTANVNADKIKPILEHYIAIQNGLLFFILELPSNQADETEIHPGKVAAFHKDIYYIDGCTQEQCLILLEKIVNLMINDGSCAFGFGCHQTQDEIMVGKYNVISLFTHQEDVYAGFFEKHGIYRTEKLLTAWDTFSQGFPGRSVRVDTDNKSVYDIPEMLADWGIYFAERREM